ncbi:hypothetical protein CLF_107060 [Clonorchis sinensis]|uniref:Uncharacterized protein n=1 Tax=Clonorchis sinensis TaxID=79923 RepID=G7YQE1_CLOSI|nr:hypothetical protein CLF_107060 [Clonorchis sinensis]
MSFGGELTNYFVMHSEKGSEDITRIDAKKDFGIWLSPNVSFSLYLQKSAQNAFAVLRIIRRTFSRITRTDFQVLYGAYIRPLLEYGNPVVYSGCTKDVILNERVQRSATKMVAGLKSVDYETYLAVLDRFPLEYRRLRGDLIPTHALFEQASANRFFTVDRARRGHDFFIRPDLRDQILQLEKEYYQKMEDDTTVRLLAGEHYDEANSSDEETPCMQSKVVKT